MDIIFIKGLTVMTVIGIYSWERRCLQKLVFDLDIGYDNQCLKIFSNCIEDYLNYQDISNFVGVLISKSCFFLLESVAESVARALILRFDNILWIRVKVTKIGAIGRNIGVGVIIERKRGDVIVV